MDIFVVSSVAPSVFIASVDEVREDMLLGTIAGLAGTQFIERRTRAKIREEIGSATEILRMNRIIALFPEGTTSDGSGVLPFKTPFFSMAEQEDSIVQPLCIKYSSIAGVPVTHENRDLVYFYGDMKFLPHFRKLFAIKSVDVEITFLKPVHSQGMSRKEIADCAYRTITEEYSADCRV